MARHFINVYVIVWAIDREVLCMNDVKTWCETLRFDVNALLSIKLLDESAFKQISIGEAEALLSKTQKIHQDVEHVCLALEKIHHTNYKAIKLDVAKITAKVFLDIDEFLYAKFPELVKAELKNADGSYVSSFRLDTSINMNAWKQDVLDILNDLNNLLHGGDICNRLNNQK